jgi:hypothetical protein
MLDQIADLIDGLMKQSGEAYRHNSQVYSNTRWKYCVALAERGWEAYDFKPIPSETEDEVIIKWRKEGEVEINVRLSFTEQCLWLRHMEQKEKNDDESTKNR